MNDDQGPRDPGPFADTPESISEARSRMKQNMALWTPRDVLIDLLRHIDRGELDIDAIIIGYRTKPDENSNRVTAHSKCGQDMYDLIALTGIVHTDLVMQLRGAA